MKTSSKRSSLSGVECCHYWLNRRSSSTILPIAIINCRMKLLFASLNEHNQPTTATATATTTTTTASAWPTHFNSLHIAEWLITGVVMVQFGNALEEVVIGWRRRPWSSFVLPVLICVCVLRAAASASATRGEGCVQIGYKSGHNATERRTEII